MPITPPKKWMKDCMTGVNKSAERYGKEVDSGAVCGDLWYNKKTQKERNAITRKIESGTYKPKLHKK